MKHTNYSHRQIRRKDAIRAAVAGVLLLAAVAAGFLGIKSWEHQQYDIPVSAEATLETAAQQRKHVTYNGVDYVQREGLQTWLLMGIDESGEAVGTESYIGGGQADLQMLLVVDHINKTWQILQLNRDSMVEVPVLGVTGKVIGTEFEQLTLAHSYGDGKKKSCQNTVTTVSNLFDGQKIDGYMALNMDAVAILNDMVGGVPVEITSDFSAVDPSLQEGTVVTLQGDQALTFVRTRKDVDDQTNLSRMARQRQYLAALQKQMEKQDADFAVRAYDAVFDYMVTDMGSKTVTEIGQYMKKYTELDLLTIDGESKVEDGYIAYYLDEDSLQQTMLTLFYETSDS